ncbi:MAG: YutD family protein [Bacilli bacterium]|nr:YutD family protein [Bacilli bacterium]
MEKIINGIKFNLIKDYRDGYDKEEIENKLTDYFYDYDYVVGDWSYGKLRLKGFCKKENKKFNKINDYNNLENYLKNECAYDCRYFVMEKIND